MNLTIASSEIHSFRRTSVLGDCEKLKSLQRSSVTPRPIRCFASASSSSSSPPKEVAAGSAIARAPIRRPERPTSASASASASSRDLANFKPPPPASPTTPKDLAADLPFQYWYSYADLPPGIPKRRLKFPNSESREKNGRLDKAATGANGILWEAVLAVGSESELDETKVVRRRGGGGDVSGFRETEKGFRGDTGDLLQEDNSPLTEEVKKKLIQSCHGNSRQIHIGWEGWNPNYVALIHSYWKKSRVCKIKCKGAITLDMDSLCNMLEVETGGTVIKRVGGSVYLFRGANYDYWRRPHHPIIRQGRVQNRFPKRLPVPSKLTEDIREVRARGRELPALCKPSKHGVYLTLLEDIRKAFETQDLVRVNCQGFYSRNMKILGSQLQALVPCELISFEFEHILMWRSRDENSPPEETVLENSEEPSEIPKSMS